MGVGSGRCPFVVIPAKAGIQFWRKQDKGPVWKGNAAPKGAALSDCGWVVAGLWGDLDRDFAPEAVIGVFQPGVGKRDVGQ